MICLKFVRLFAEWDLKMTKKIFVFGSNEGGIHGGGAARVAYEKCGARWGFSYGHMGDSFAIPTKGFVVGRTGKPWVGDTLPLERIQQYVQGFLAYAAGHPELEFQVTCIGCGLAGLEHKDVAPMFKEATPNCFFDNLWFPYLTTGAGDHPQHNYWGTY